MRSTTASGDSSSRWVVVSLAATIVIGAVLSLYWQQLLAESAGENEVPVPDPNAPRPNNQPIPGRADPVPENPNDGWNQPGKDWDKPIPIPPRIR